MALLPTSGRAIAYSEVLSSHIGNILHILPGAIVDFLLHRRRCKQIWYHYPQVRSLPDPHFHESKPAPMTRG